MSVIYLPELDGAWLGFKAGQSGIRRTSHIDWVAEFKLGRGNGKDEKPPLEPGCWVINARFCRQLLAFPDILPRSCGFR